MCVMLAHVDPGGDLSQFVRVRLIKYFREKFRQRMHLYERVAAPEKWDTIFKPLTEPRRPPVTTPLK